MEPFWKRWFVSPGLHEDVFGEVFSGREVIYDAQNNDLMEKMMRSYIAECKSKGLSFHPQFESDQKSIQFYSWMRGVWFASGVVFGLTVYNPNFTARRSWYMRKFAPFVWGCVALNFGHKLY